MVTGLRALVAAPRGECELERVCVRTAFGRRTRRATVRRARDMASVGR